MVATMAKLLTSRSVCKREKKEEPGVPQFPFRIHPSDLRPATGPHLLKVPPPPSSAKLGAKPLTHGPLGDIPDLNYITSMIALTILNEDV
jgi:hypothetical protein